MSAYFGQYPILAFVTIHIKKHVIIDDDQIQEVTSMMRPRCSDTYNIVLYYIPTCYIYLHRHSYTTMTLLLSCIATVSPTIYRVHSSAYNGSMVLLNTC